MIPSTICAPASGCWSPFPCMFSMISSSESLTTSSTSSGGRIGCVKTRPRVIQKIDARSLISAIARGAFNKLESSRVKLSRKCDQLVGCPVKIKIYPCGLLKLPFPTAMAAKMFFKLNCGTARPSSLSKPSDLRLGDKPDKRAAVPR